MKVCVCAGSAETSLTPFHFYEFHEGTYSNVYTILYTNYYTILYYTILYYTILISTSVLYSTVQYCPRLVEG
jgi:hypothetical protein